MNKVLTNITKENNTMQLVHVNKTNLSDDTVYYSTSFTTDTFNFENKIASTILYNTRDSNKH